MTTHRVCLVVLIGLITAACNNSPTQPNRCSDLTGLSVSCAPGGNTLQCHAAETLYCGPGPDVTAQTQWQSSDPGIVTISSAGVAQSVSPGDAQIIAAYMGINSPTRVRVLSGQPPLLVGDIAGNVSSTPGCGVNNGVPDVLVTVIAGLNTGLSTTTGNGGFYSFPNIVFAPTVTLRASKAGYQDAIVNGEAGYPPGIPNICITPASAG
jgi:hypothetical protein